MFVRPYESAFCTLTTTKIEYGVSKNTDDTVLTRKIKSASGIIERGVGRTFVPYQADHPHDVLPDSPLIVLADDLLSVTAITDGSGILTTSDYQLLETAGYPKHAIIPAYGGAWQWGSTYAMNAAVSINGLWGFNRNPNNMWVNRTTLTAAINASTTTVPVASVSNIEILSYIKIGSEYMQVTAINTLNLTVERGVNGTTAAAHDNAAVVATYRIESDIEQATITLALYLYETRDSFGERVATVDGSVLLTKLLPSNVRDTLDSLRRERWSTP